MITRKCIDNDITESAAFLLNFKRGFAERNHCQVMILGGKSSLEAAHSPFFSLLQHVIWARKKNTIASAQVANLFF